MSPKPPSRVRHALTRLDKPAAPAASPTGKSAAGQTTQGQTTQGHNTQGQTALRRTAEELKGDRAATIKQAMDKSMSWFEKLIPSRIRTDASTKRAVPEGVWAKCPGCQAILYRAELERNLEVCPKCSHHNRLSGRRRLETFLDPEEREEIGVELESLDPLRFKDLKKYKDRLVAAQKQSSEKEAMIVMRGRLKGQPIVASAFEFGFMGGSMGSVVGERFVRGVEAALEQKSPYVCFSASGGARMQESLFSLMQMAKTSAALGRLREHSLPFVSVMTDPTMGGVSASLAMLGDLNIAEPNALIGFAGPRVIEQTVHEKLPEGFQRSEFLMDKGALDMIMDRRDLRERIADLLAILTHRPRYVRTVVPV